MSASDTDLIWVHEDSLRADHPAFGEAGIARACFIWDDAYMARMGYGLKRRVFIYETLLELPVEIYAGPIVETLQHLMKEYGAAQIVTGKTPNPLLKEMMGELRNTTKVTAIADKAFVQMDAQPELEALLNIGTKPRKKRFFMTGAVDQSLKVASIALVNFFGLRFGQR